MAAKYIHSPYKPLSKTVWWFSEDPTFFYNGCRKNFGGEYLSDFLFTAAVTTAFVVLFDGSPKTYKNCGVSTLAGGDIGWPKCHASNVWDISKLQLIGLVGTLIYHAVIGARCNRIQNEFKFTVTSVDDIPWRWNDYCEVPVFNLFDKNEPRPTSNHVTGYLGKSAQDQNDKNDYITSPLILKGGSSLAIIIVTGYLKITYLRSLCTPTFQDKVCNPAHEKIMDICSGLLQFVMNSAVVSDTMPLIFGESDCYLELD